MYLYICLFDRVINLLGFLSLEVVMTTSQKKWLHFIFLSFIKLQVLGFRIEKSLSINLKKIGGQIFKKWLNLSTIILNLIVNMHKYVTIFFI